MPTEIVTNHENEEVDIIVDLGTYQEPSNIEDINDLLGSVLAEGNTSVEPVEKLFGKCSVTDGGFIGNLLLLSRSHIEASVKNGELTKGDVGKVYAAILPQAIQSAISIYDSGIKNDIAKREANLNAAMLSVELSKSLSDAELNYYKMLSEKYSLQSLLPLDRELKKEQLEDMHIQHAINKYRLDTDMPLQTVGLDKQNTLITKDIDTKIYNLETLLPLESTEKQKDIDTKIYNLETLLPLESTMKEKDIDTKIYNLETLLPLESTEKQKDIDTKIYNLETLLPLESTEKQKDIDTKIYNLSTILPLESTMKQKDIDTKIYNLETLLPLESTMKEKDIDTKIYNLSTILPLESTEKQKDIDTKIYNLSTMLPAQVDDMIAKKNIAEKDLELKEYNLTQIMPKDLAIKASQVVINAKEADIKQYELVNTLPTQNAFTVAQRLKVESDTDAVELDIQIKDYYRSNIQVFERNLSEYKSIQEGVNAGSITNKPNSLPARRIDQLVVQTDLYTRQKDHYNDIVNQKLLDTIMNYNAMIFPDNTSPDKLIGWAAYTDNSENVAKALSPEINTPPS